MKQRLILTLAVVLVMILLTGCGGGTQDAGQTPPQAPVATTAAESPQVEPEATQEPDEKEQIVMKMNVQIGDRTFTATLEDNQAVAELVEMMEEGPVTITLDDYGGFEKVGSLGRSLTTSNSQTTTTAGDIVLYNGNNIVMFYGSNSWSYTRLGRIDDLTGWADALGPGSVTAVFTLAN